jgi:quercetin dioxygenase-like cupin family protein
MRKVLAYDQNLMMCEVIFEKDAIGSLHSHPHGQITYVAVGTFAFTVNGETTIVGAGDSILIPSEAAHGVKALEKGILIDVFSPMRKDFV